MKMIVRNKMFTCFFENGKPHKEDGPALEWGNGYKAWYKNGERHREDGPAIEYHNGRKEWWFKGRRHRTDGPAVEKYERGIVFYGEFKTEKIKEWWVHGTKMTEDVFDLYKKGGGEVAVDSFKKGEDEK